MLTLPRKHLLAALFCIGLGLFVAIRGYGYSIGSLANVGPGFFPFVLGSMLVLCGVGIYVQAWREAGSPLVLELRPYLAIPAAIIVFALGVGRIGILPTILLTTVVASLADRRSGIVGTLVLSVALMALVYVVFVLILRIPLEPFMWRP